MPHSAARFAVAALATWRVTHLLAEEDGPADVVLRARAALGASRVGALMDCFQCLSLWVALPFAQALRPASARERCTWWLAVSGAACLLERGGTTSTLEGEHGLLWEGARGAQDVDAPNAADGSGAGSAHACAAALRAPHVDARAGWQHAPPQPPAAGDRQPWRAAATAGPSALRTAG